MMRFQLSSDLPSTTWLRHAAFLRELALTGPAHQRHVYREAAAEAEAHAAAANLLEVVIAAADVPALAEAA